MIYGTLFTFPEATTALEAVGDWSSPLFTDFLPIIYVLIAIAVIAMILKIISGR